jgi:hypothetical protein
MLAVTMLMLKYWRGEEGISLVVAFFFSISSSGGGYSSNPAWW